MTAPSPPDKKVHGATALILLTLAFLVSVAPAFVATAVGAAADGDCAGAPPPQAQAAGLTRLAFCDDFASASTINMSGALEPGYKWYRSGLPFGYDSTPASQILVEDGKLKLNTTHGSSNLNLITTYKSPTGAEGFYVDRQPAYFEARLTFPHKPARSSRHPAFWTMDVCHLYHWPGRCLDYLEIDFFEWIDDDYIASIHYWLDVPGRKPKEHLKKDSNNRSPSNHIVDVEADFERLQTYGTLVLPDKGIFYYFNNKKMKSNYLDRYRWINMAGEGRYPVILGSDDWPMTVDWVRVWVRP